MHRRKLNKTGLWLRKHELILLLSIFSMYFIGCAAIYEVVLSKQM